MVYIYIHKKNALTRKNKQQKHYTNLNLHNYTKNIPCTASVFQTSSVKANYKIYHMLAKKKT